MFAPLSAQPPAQALALTLSLLALVTTPGTLGAVHRCAQADGSLLFTQFSCPPQTTRLSSVDPVRVGANTGTLSIITSTALSKAERQALKALEADLSSERLRRQQQQKRRARARAKQQTRARTNCLEAHNALDRLADTRRKGYSAAREQQLETEEARWRQLKKSTC